MRDTDPKPPKVSPKKLSWPYQPRPQPPVCLQPSSVDLKPPWRPANPKSEAFEPRVRLLSVDDLAVPRTMKTCREELTLQQIMASARPSTAANEREPLHCECRHHWNPSSRPSSAPGPKKRPAWRPGASKPAAFDPNLSLLSESPNSATAPPAPPPQPRALCKTCGLRAKPSPVLRTLAARIETLMRDHPFGWCIVNPTHKRQAELRAERSSSSSIRPYPEGGRMTRGRSEPQESESEEDPAT